MNRKVLLIAAAGTVALVAAWFLLLWSPQSSRLDGVRAREEEAVEINTALELRIARLRDLRARRPEFEADLAALKAAVPASPELDAFLLDVDEAADQAGVDITSISPSKPASAATAEATPSTTSTTAATTGTTGTTGGAATGAPPSAITIALDAAGGYFQVLDFINRLDDLPRVVVVDSLSLASGSGGGTGEEEPRAASSGTSPSQLTMSISARMFTTAPPAAADGSGGASTTTTTTTAGGSGQ
jgi:Tfp pilus assembly protein PilO